MGAVPSSLDNSTSVFTKSSLFCSSWVCITQTLLRFLRIVWKPAVCFGYQAWISRRLLFSLHSQSCSDWINQGLQFKRFCWKYFCLSGLPGEQALTWLLLKNLNQNHYLLFRLLVWGMCRRLAPAGPDTIALIDFDDLLKRLLVCVSVVESGRCYQTR